MLRETTTRIKSLIARAITMPPIGATIARLTGDRIPVFRFDLRIDTSNPYISPSTKAQLFFGIFESAELRLVRSHLTGSTPVVELGSGIGVVTSAVARKVSGRAPVVAVEANERLLDSLKVNTAHYPDVRVVHGAIDYSRATHIQLALGTTHIGSAVTRTVTNDVVTVPAVRLSTILRDAQLQEFSLVCDIEGAEVPMFQQEHDTMQGCREIVIELHHTTVDGRAYTPDDVLQALDALGLKRVASIGDVHYLRRDQVTA